MKKITLLAVCILTSAICHLTSLMVFSQDIHFARFWMTPLLINPAQAGVEHDLRAIINYRNQWNSVATPSSTANVSFDTKIAKKKGRKGFSAMGINIFHDKAGSAQMKTLQGNIAYAYHVYLNRESTLGGGLYGGFAQRSINSSDLQWMSQYDGSSYSASLPSGEQSGNSSLSFLDLRGGLHYEYGWDKLDFSAGVGFFHVNRPKYSFYGSAENLSMRTVGYANSLVRFTNSNFSLVPGFIYSMQGKSKELFLGTMFRYTFKGDANLGYVKGSAISLGAHYRNKDAVIPVLIFEFSQYSIGLSYDVNISKLKTASKGLGGFEISLRFVNPNPFRPKSASSI